MTTNVAWVKNPMAITGLDPLGVKSPCEYVYSRLLPGITNVTERARYFSFYPWLIWAIEHHNGSLKSKPTYEIFRRADCLNTVIGLHHHATLGKPNDSLHFGLTGSRKLMPVVDELQQNGNPIRLSRYAAMEDTPDRYFMNKLGGFGQYYLGPLHDAGILKRNIHDEIVYSEDRGLSIAKAFDSGVNRTAFFEVLEQDEVTSSELDALIGFCPCQLHKKPIEQAELVSYLFNQSETYNSPVFEHRSNTLGAMLELTKVLQHSDQPMYLGGYGVRSFLECVYRTSLPDSTPWTISNESLNESLQGWKQYYANEMLSLALQTLFWAGLSRLSEDETHLTDTNAFGSWFVETFIPADNHESNVGELIDEKFYSLPKLAEASDSKHEVNLAIELLEIAEDKYFPQRYEKAVQKSLELLLTLAARWGTEDLESVFPFELPAAYHESYPVNIFSFLRNVEDTWRRMELREWVGWLTARWCIESHIRIALGKLRYESRDTFKIIPSENGLRVIEPTGTASLSELLLPGFTNPRVRQSLQILFDVGALSADETGALSVSIVGEGILGGGT